MLSGVQGTPTPHSQPPQTLGLRTPELCNVGHKGDLIQNDIVQDNIVQNITIWYNIILYYYLWARNGFGVGFGGLGVWGMGLRAFLQG